MQQQLTWEQIKDLQNKIEANSLKIILDYKKINRLETILLIFFNDQGNIQFSVGSRYDYSIPKDRKIDYWQNAEYYSSHEEAYKIYKKLINS